MAETDTKAAEQKRLGAAFREKPFFIALMFPRVQSPMVREQLYIELLNDEVLHNRIFGVVEVGH